MQWANEQTLSATLPTTVNPFNRPCTCDNAHKTLRNGANEWRKEESLKKDGIFLGRGEEEEEGEALS